MHVLELIYLMTWRTLVDIFCGLILFALLRALFMMYVEVISKTIKLLELCSRICSDLLLSFFNH